ncbi:hypothetical protein AOLI_G00046940 [Acnodon oligacanthus]
MTDSLEVEMESQEEQTKEAAHDGSNKEEQDESWKQKSKSKIHQGEIIEGKREKKTVQRLDMQVPKPKEKPKIESIGKGDKLGDIARVNHAIGRLKAPLLKPLHKILYDRPGAVASLRKHLRLFNGFPFEIDSDPYNKKREKMTRLPKVQLKTICQILDLERSGNQAVLVDRIMQFLANPTNSGKPVILKKKRKKKTTKDAKREKTASKSKQKQPESGKSRAIVTDSSSDEEEEDDEDEAESKNKDAETSDSQKHGDESNSEVEEEMEKSEGSEDSPEESEDEETSKSKKTSSKKKSTPKKVAKKAEDSSDQSASDSAEDTAPKKTKKKPAAQKNAPAKPVPKTKKADSSSNKKKNTVSKSRVQSDSSDDDEPLIKMIKKPPTNEQLKGSIKDLLKDANLEEVTMKQICQQVYDLYPDYDLTDRKDFIKETVKSLIS